MDFIAIDVETANPALSSICQIGIASFKGGEVTEQWETLVDPEDYFHPMNVAVHGILPNDVAGSPKYPEVFEGLKSLLTGKVVVSHMPFDMTALERVRQKHNLAEIECTWLDSAKVTRRTWPEFAYKGYGLKNITNALGIQFIHHRAVEDARAAGEVLIRAIQETGRSLTEWVNYQYCPLSPRTRSSQKSFAHDSANGDLVVFTGSLVVPREEASELAAKAGYGVANSVTKDTTILIVGAQDFRFLAGQEKSSKHRKAEDLIAKGQDLRILGEEDFWQLVGLHGKQRGAHPWITASQ